MIFRFALADLTGYDVPMKTSTLAGLVLILAFIGIADAWYLTQSAYTDTPLTCDISGLSGCNIVAQSPYSHFLGFPLALYGVFFFAFLFVLAAVALYSPRRTVYLGLYTLGLVGAFASVIFMGIQFFLIKAICVYCLGSALITFLVFACAQVLWKRARRVFPAPAMQIVSSVLP